LVKVVKINIRNLFPRTTPFARVTVFPYPTDVYYVQDSQSIYLPSVIAEFYLNEFGYGEFQAVPNDLIEPKPNFYVVRIMYNGKYYYFVINVKSTHPDLVDLRDVIVKTIPSREKICEAKSFRIVLGDIYV
jgi:hypothetical protein